MRATVLAVILICTSPRAPAAPVTYGLAWNGPNDHGLVGVFTFDDSLLGQSITEADLLYFAIDGSSGASSLGRFEGLPASFNFDSATGELGHPLSWNVTDSGSGFLTTQSVLGGNVSISEQLYLNGAPVPGAANSFLFAPSVRSTRGLPPGPRALHIYTLRIPPGACPHPNPALTGCNNAGDTLPVGNPLFYSFAIFDTGGTAVAIGNQAAASDADLLNLCRPTGNCNVNTFLPRNLDLRVWGLGATDPAQGNGAPLDAPQAEVTGLRVRPDAGVGITLLGAPLAARTVALIDYPTEVVRSYSFLQPPEVRAADITFVRSPRSSPVPILALELELERVGTFGTAADGASTGPRFLLKNTSVANGTSRIDDVSHDFLYDTGNTLTQVTHATALALGIDPVNDAPIDIKETNTVAGVVFLRGFVVDEFMVTSVFGDPYVLEQPVIYVRPQNVSLGGIDVNVGSDYFRNAKIVFDGPGDRIWIARESYPGRQELIDNGDGTITDPTSNLMWLADAGYAATMGQGPNSDGRMTWNDAIAWADGVQFVGYNDWRLPRTLDPDPSCVPNPGTLTLKNCRGGEMGYLYWAQGITTVTPGPFSNVPPAEYYWSSTPYLSASAWVHSFRHGEQLPGNTAPSVLLAGWPVRDRLPSDTSPGQNVAIESGGARIVFANVNAGGATTVTVSQTNPVGGQANFRLLGDFYDIETTADYSGGSVTVCLAYPRGTDTSSLELLHWDGRMWVPLAGTIIDSGRMTICGTTASLSWFAIGEPRPRRWLWLLLLALFV